MATFDAAVRGFLNSYPAGTVVAHREGLETQFWRIAERLPGSVLVFDVVMQVLTPSYRLWVRCG